jgi:hypothetical protein
LGTGSTSIAEANISLHQAPKTLRPLASGELSVRAACGGAQRGTNRGRILNINYFDLTVNNYATLGSFYASVMTDNLPVNSPLDDKNTS